MELKRGQPILLSAIASGPVADDGSVVVLLNTERESGHALRVIAAEVVTDDAEYKRLVLEGIAYIAQTVSNMGGLGTQSPVEPRWEYHIVRSELYSYLKRLGSESANNCELEGEQDGEA